jgi:glycine cleavage system transcriptional repressor
MISLFYLKSLFRGISLQRSRFSDRLHPLRFIEIRVKIMSISPLINVNNQHCLIIVAHGHRDNGLLDAIARACKISGCNILESKLTSIGESCTFISAVAGSWNTIAKLEATLPPLAEQLDFSIELKRMLMGKEEASLPYQVQVTAHDRPGIINDLTTFFAQQQVKIEEMECQTYQARNHTSIANIHLMVSIPAKQHLANLRERFIVYCEDRNLDVVMEPYKSL